MFDRPAETMPREALAGLQVRQRHPVREGALDAMTIEVELAPARTTRNRNPGTSGITPSQYRHHLRRHRQGAGQVTRSQGKAAWVRDLRRQGS
jgi:hypothetical protein